MISTPWKTGRINYVHKLWQLHYLQASRKSRSDKRGAIIWGKNQPKAGFWSCGLKLLHSAGHEHGVLPWFLHNSRSVNTATAAIVNCIAITGKLSILYSVTDTDRTKYLAKIHFCLSRSSCLLVLHYKRVLLFINKSVDGGPNVREELLTL